MRLHRAISSVFIGLLLFAGALSGCTRLDPSYDLSAPSFKGKQPIALNVSEIRIRNAYPAEKRPNHVELFFPTTPVEAVTGWANERLQASGSDKALEVMIHDAGVVQTSLETKKGIKGAFTKEPSEQFDATLDVELKIYGADRFLPEATVRTKVTAMRQLREDATPEQRDALYAEITRDLLNRFDASIEQEIESYFSAYMAGPEY